MAEFLPLPAAKLFRVQRDSIELDYLAIYLKKKSVEWMSHDFIGE